MQINSRLSNLSKKNKRDELGLRKDEDGIVGILYCDVEKKKKKLNYTVSRCKLIPSCIPNKFSTMKLKNTTTKTPKKFKFGDFLYLIMSFREATFCRQTRLVKSHHLIFFRTGGPFNTSLVLIASALRNLWLLQNKKFKYIQ